MCNYTSVIIRWDRIGGRGMGGKGVWEGLKYKRLFN